MILETFIRSTGRLLPYWIAFLRTFVFNIFNKVFDFLRIDCFHFVLSGPLYEILWIFFIAFFGLKANDSQRTVYESDSRALKDKKEIAKSYFEFWLKINWSTKTSSLCFCFCEFCVVSR